LEGEESSLWDKIIFDKVKAKFGGRLKWMVAGGAPLSIETQQYMSVVLGVSVLQGYGLTENCAAGTISHPQDRVFGRVGAPLPCNEVKLVNVPEMGYTANDVNEFGEPTPRGEICIHGGNVTLGYYKQSEKTKESFITDDEKKIWFYTGDIGMWHPDGTLQIIDRKKDLVKLKHGEYIALGHLESVYKSHYVDNICVHGDSHHEAPVGIIVPNEHAVTAFAKSIQLSGDLNSLIQNAAIKKEILASLLKSADAAKLQKVERLGDLIISSEPWTAESGLLTDAMKLKRHEIYKKYQRALEAVYAQWKE